MCAEIDKLDGHHQAACYLLTDRTQRMRYDQVRLPGRSWPMIAGPQDGPIRAKEWVREWWSALPWWKWWALDEWLSHHPEILRLIWIDDQLREHRATSRVSPARRAWTIETAIRTGTGLDPLLLAPDSETGMRPLDIRIVNDWILGVR